MELRIPKLTEEEKITFSMYKPDFRLKGLALYATPSYTDPETGDEYMDVHSHEVGKVDTIFHKRKSLI